MVKENQYFFARCLKAEATPLAHGSPSHCPGSETGGVGGLLAPQGLWESGHSTEMEFMSLQPG